MASGETRLLYLAPERLMTERMLEALEKLDVRLIAIDEAHCISQWGPAFRPEYEDLSRLREIFPNVPIIALTATADESTRADIAAQLFAGRVETLVLGFDRPNIKLSVEAQAGRQARKCWISCSDTRAERHRLLPVAQEDRGDRGLPRSATASGRWPITPA